MKLANALAIGGPLFAAAVLTVIAIIDATRDKFFPAPADGTSAGSKEALDLLAQQSMAGAAWLMFIVTGLSLFVGVITLLLLRDNLIEARKVSRDAERSAKAAEDAAIESRRAVDTTREVGRAQVRAYMAITGVEIAFENSPFESVRVLIQNAGQSPARRVSIEASVERRYIRVVDEGAFSPVPADHQSTHRRYLPDVPAQSPHVAELATIDLFLNLSDEEITDVDGVTIIVEGTVKYADVFEDYEVLPFAFRATYMPLRSTAPGTVFTLERSPVQRPGF